MCLVPAGVGQRNYHYFFGFISCVMVLAMMVLPATWHAVVQTWPLDLCKKHDKHSGSRNPRSKLVRHFTKKTIQDIPTLC